MFIMTSPPAQLPTSNVVYQGEDLLGSISNASYTITSTPGVGGDTPSPSPFKSPVSGTTENTIFLLAGGGGLFSSESLRFLLAK